MRARGSSLGTGAMIVISEGTGIVKLNLYSVLAGSGRCGLIDGAVTVINSSLDKFRGECERQLNS